MSVVSPLDGVLDLTVRELLERLGVALSIDQTAHFTPEEGISMTRPGAFFSSTEKAPIYRAPIPGPFNFDWARCQVSFEVEVPKKPWASALNRDRMLCAVRRGSHHQGTVFELRLNGEIPCAELGTNWGVKQGAWRRHREVVRGDFFGRRLLALVSMDLSKRILRADLRLDGESLSEMIVEPGIRSRSAPFRRLYVEIGGERGARPYNAPVGFSFHNLEVSLEPPA